MNTEFFIQYFWFFGIVFPVLLVLVSLITTIVLTNRNLRAERKFGVNCIEKDIKALAKESEEVVKAVAEIIQANGALTLKAIEQNGKQTRESILALERAK